MEAVMFGEKATRTLLRPADPAHGVEIPPSRTPATELIARAEWAADAGPIGRVTTGRRRVLAIAAAIVAAGSATGYALTRESSGPTRTGPPSEFVIVPVAFELNDSPPPAADRLRDLAGRIVDAPADRHTGRYEFIHWKGWGGVTAVSPEGHELHHVEEMKSWTGPQGPGLDIRTWLPPEYVTEEARQYWEALGLQQGDTTERNPREPEPPLPTDPAELRDSLSIRHGPGAATKAVMTAYQNHVVPRAQRAEILRALAEVDGFTWRGTVTDLAGRTGVAISADDHEHEQRNVLVFDARTGELLAQELHRLEPLQVLVYTLFFAYDRTDRTG
jgi:hypothetical protein